MSFERRFRLSSHAVVTDQNDAVLLLKATYGDCGWGLPGGALEPGETIHQALLRECQEELGIRVDISYLSGVYSHSAVESQAFIFRCSLPAGSEIRLSNEHSAFRYTLLTELSKVQRLRVEDCLQFSGQVVSRAF